jgi:hypothetical protein
MYQCPKCKGWIDAADDTYSHACTDTLQRIADKVAEHKDPDYLLAKAAFTVIRDLKPSYDDPACRRAYGYQYEVYCRSYDIWNAALFSVYNRPRRRWQDKEIDND